MVSYNTIKDIIHFKTTFKISVKTNYVVLTLPTILDYHITIYEDQWDYYADFTGFEYYLFHISSNDTLHRCSTYYWVDIHTMDIVNIPPKYFRYEQESYDMYSSTRKSCESNDSVKILLQKFEKLLKYLKKYSKYHKKHNNI